MMDRRARKDMIDATDIAEQIENAEAADPIEPTDRIDPIEPIDNTEPFEAIDSSESSDQRDHFEAPADGSTPQILIPALPATQQKVRAPARASRRARISGASTRRQRQPVNSLDFDAQLAGSGLLQ
jgi:hypothetical protein